MTAWHVYVYTTFWKKKERFSCWILHGTICMSYTKSILHFDDVVFEYVLSWPCKTILPTDNVNKCFIGDLVNIHEERDRAPGIFYDININSCKSKQHEETNWNGRRDEEMWRNISRSRERIIKGEEEVNVWHEQHETIWCTLYIGNRSS
jgi:hypothetical protein